MGGGGGSTEAEEMEGEETGRYPPGGARGQQARGSPSSSPTAHSALLSDTSIDLSSRYGHRLAALLSTALFTSLCLQTKAGHRLHLTGDAVSLALLFLVTLHALPIVSLPVTEHV